MCIVIWDFFGVWKFGVWSFKGGQAPGFMASCFNLPRCKRERLHPLSPDFLDAAFSMKSALPALLSLVIAGFAMPPWSQAAGAAPAPRIVKLRTGVDNAMKFDIGTLTAAPGETIKIVLTNASTLPKEVMGHNWVLLTAGTDPLAFAAAGASEFRRR
jgi:hypothetical protein